MAARVRNWDRLPLSWRGDDGKRNSLPPSSPSSAAPDARHHQHSPAVSAPSFHCTSGKQYGPPYHGELTSLHLWRIQNSVTCLSLVFEKRYSFERRVSTWIMTNKCSELTLRERNYRGDKHSLWIGLCRIWRLSTLESTMWPGTLRLSPDFGYGGPRWLPWQTAENTWENAELGSLAWRSSRAPVKKLTIVHQNQEHKPK